MISQQRSGIPSTQTVLADSDGVCVRLPTWSTSVRIAAKSPVRLYWNAKDFDDDTNGISLSGDEDDDTFSANATVANIWLRGLGSQSEVTVTTIGIG